MKKSCLFMQVTLLAIAVLLGVTSVPAAHASASDQAVGSHVPLPLPAKPEVLPQEEEMKLALSAAPAHLQADAGVYVLQAHGYVKLRDSKNNFTCIVNRDGPLNLKPTCYDAEGTASILPVVVRYGAMLMQGMPENQINAAIKKGFSDGTFHAPRRPGVAYMLSHGIRYYDVMSETIQTFPPHVMFYAPNLTNKDIGSKGDFSYGLPSIGYMGPQGYMIVVCGEDCGKSNGQ